jgi:hypothetical protein
MCVHMLYVVHTVHVHVLYEASYNIYVYTQNSHFRTTNVHQAVMNKNKLNDRFITHSSTNFI